MALDNFKEEIVIKKNRALNNILYFLLWPILVITALFGYLNVTSCFSGGAGFQWLPLVVGLVSLGIAVLIFLNKDKIRLEYEYTFTNGDMDIAAVYNNSKRKYLCAFSMKMVEAAGVVNDNRFNKYLRDNSVKKHNWFLNRDKKLYYFYFSKNSVKHIAVLELSDDMVEMVKSNNYLNFGVWQD